MKKSLDQFNAQKKINVFEEQDSEKINKARFKRNGYGNTGSMDRQLAPINN